MYCGAGAVVCTLFYVIFVLPFQENRKDLVRVNDRFLNWLPLWDVSWLMSLMLGLLLNLQIWERFIGCSEENFTLAYQVVVEYALCLGVKSFTMLLLPLEVPQGFIQLQDPVAAALAYLSGGAKEQKQQIATRDLFFSGHTSVLCLCLIFAGSSTYFWFYLIVGVIMICSMLLARVHYTIDILVAPFIVSTIHFLTNANISQEYQNLLQYT